MEWVQPVHRWMLIYYHQTNIVTIGSSQYTIQSGDMVLFPPGTPCAHADVGPKTHCDYLSFELVDAKSCLVVVPAVIRQVPHVLENFRKASSQILITPATCQAFAWNLLWSVSESLSRYRQAGMLYSGEDFIAKNLGRKFTVQEVADHCGIEQRVLLNLFRQQHGVTVKEFITRKRISESSRLLLTTDLTVKQVAAQVGFDDLQHFNKTIRNMTGMSPRELRKSGEKNRSARQWDA